MQLQVVAQPTVGRASLYWHQVATQAKQKLEDILSEEPPNGPIWKEAAAGFQRMLSAALSARARSTEGMLSAMPVLLRPNQVGSKRRFLGLVEKIHGKAGTGKRVRGGRKTAAADSPTAPPLVQNPKKGKPRRARDLREKAARTVGSPMLEQLQALPPLVAGVQQAARPPLQDVSNFMQAGMAPSCALAAP